MTEEESNWFEDLEEDIEYDSRIQRPESMIIPIGGVWRPDDEPPEQFFLDQPGNSANSTNNSTKCNFDTVQQIQQQIQQSSTISTTETTAIDSSNSLVILSASPYIPTNLQYSILCFVFYLMSVVVFSMLIHELNFIQILG